MTTRLVAGLALFVYAPAAAQVGAPAADDACRLPATTAVERGKVRIPAAIGVVSIAVERDARPAGKWRRAAGDRASVAEVPLEPRLEYGVPAELTATIERRPTAGEMASFKSWLAARAAAAAPFTPASLDSDAERELRPRCSTAWRLPLPDSLPASVRSRDSARRALAEGRRQAQAAAAGLASEIERAGRVEQPLSRLRAQARDTGAATPRELVLLDQLIEATAADTGVERLGSFTIRAERTGDLLASWHARPPPRIRPATVDSTRAVVSALLGQARELVDARRAVADARADSVRATARLAADLYSAFGEAGFVTDTLGVVAVIPEPDAGKWRIGVGAHYTAPVRSALLGHPGATNRIFPGVFVHWSPSPSGGRRPVTIDFGLALNSVGRRGAARDLFWRSSVLLGASVHPKGFVRVGAGVQLIREVAEDHHSRLRIPLYLSLSLAQFRLPL